MLVDADKKRLTAVERSGAHQLIETLCQCNTVVKVYLLDKSRVGK